MNTVIQGDSLHVLKTLGDESVDLLCTDPPYGYSFMGKAWDKALPDIGIFKECLRVLKPGAFAFVMSAPRSDVCSRMMLMLEDAGFNIAFTPIYWTYASGFPKAMNIGKAVDKRNGRHAPDQDFKDYLKAAKKNAGLTSEQIDRALGFTSGVFSQHYVGNTHQVEYPTVEKYQLLKTLLKLDDRYNELIEREEAEREVVGTSKNKIHLENLGSAGFKEEWNLTTAATPEAKALDGSYGGFQPKPAVEVIIVAMKPLSEKTYVDQALKNGKGITWLDDCRVGTGTGETKTVHYPNIRGNNYSQGNATYEDAGTVEYQVEDKGRFPANLLVSGDVLKDHSRFFSLDAWAQTLPFLAVPKASKSEKDAGLEHMTKKAQAVMMTTANNTSGIPSAGMERFQTQPKANHHPTVKPLKLMSFLITLGSRPGDVVLDPFLGSGTTAIAAKQLGRNYIGIEKEAEYVEIAEARIKAINPTLV